MTTVRDAAELRFFAEGGANVIYTVASHPDQLLRLRKDVTTSADYVRTSQIAAYLSTTIRPRFVRAGIPEAIADHELLRVDRKVLYELNEALRKQEKKGLRDPARIGCTLELNEGMAENNRRS